MTLGTQLEATIKKFQDANIHDPMAQSKADIHAIEQLRDERVEYMETLMKYVVDTIKSNNVPAFVETDTIHTAWLTLTQDGEAPYQDLWGAFVKKLDEEQLAVKVSVSRGQNVDSGNVRIFIKPYIKLDGIRRGAGEQITDN